MATTYTFYIVSDNIQTKSKDKERMNKVASAFKYLGHKVKVCEIDPNAHSNPQKWGCQGKNDVWVCIFGGVDIEVISDHTGYKQSDWFKKRLKNAHLMYIFMSSPEGRAVSIDNSKKIGLAHDGKGNIKGLYYIKNPSDFLKKKGITYIQDGTTDGIVQKIRNSQFKGASFLTTSTSDTVTTTEYTIKHGYDTSKPFEGYLKIHYTVNKKTGKWKTLYVDFTSESQETGKDSFNNDPLIFANGMKYTNEIPLLEFIKSANDQKRNKSDKYYLKKVTLVRKFTKESVDGDLYDKKTDDASYKLNLYRLGLSTGEDINPQTVGCSGKTLLDATKNILDKCGYNHHINYGLHRAFDKITFDNVTDYSAPVQEFNEGIDGNIIGISNIKYSPTSDLVNNSVVVFKSKLDENKDEVVYRYARKSRIRDVLRYGEQTHLESVSDTSAFVESSQKAYDNLSEYYKPFTSYTVRVEGFPLANIGDYVSSKTVNPLLTNEYIVKSRKIITNVEERPMIQTEYGLGDVDNKLKVKHNLAEQRKALIREKLDLNEPLGYKDTMTDNFIQYLDSDGIDYYNYEVWVDE